jgi:ketosteroid isomerase-like protein
MLFKNYQPEMKVSCDEVVVSGDWAHVIGTVTGKMTSRTDNQSSSLNDAFVMILRKTKDDKWQASRLMWHAKGKKE